MRSIWARKEGQTKGMDEERGEYSVFVMKKMEPRYVHTSTDS